MSDKKFRAWDKEFNRYESDTIHMSLDMEGRVYNLQTGDGSDRYLIEQFTGLKDKDGVEIWENDIVRQTFNGEVTGYQIGKVVILPSQGVCMSFPRTFVETSGEDQEWNLEGYKNIRHYRSEVIGNIHQNGDLLK